jgi:ATP-binding cassette subfamily B protein
MPQPLRDDGRRANGPRLALVRRLFAEVRPYWRQVAVIAALDLLATPLVLLTPVPLKIAVDNVLGDQPPPRFLDVLPDSLTRTDARLLVVAATMLVVIGVLAQVQQMGSTVLRVKVGEALVQDVRERLFGHAQRLSIQRHDSRGSTDTVYRIQHDAMALQRVTIDGILVIFRASVTLVAMIIIIASLDWQLALIAIAICPPLIMLTRGYRVRVRPRYRNVKGIESDAMRIVQEALAALRVVKAFGQEDGERDRFSERSGMGVRARVSLAWAEGWFGLLVNLFTAAGTAAVLLVGVLHVQNGTLTLGELLIVVAYLAQLYAPLKLISRNTASLQSSLASAERVFEFLDEQPDVPQQPHARPLAHARGLVEFVHVSMSYEGQQEVLRDISLLVEPGVRVGICGVTGAGKTTLVNLLGRFYDPTSGRVLLDGVDLREYRLADLRRQLAIVLQEPVLFSTSIGENIRYARPEASMDEVVAAAEQAGAHEFITRLPQGYDTTVGERGMRLSGGERQRVSLARAFLKQGQILILDEPTSSVDTHTEAKIMTAMERLMTGRTSFLIAHRTSTLDGCDMRIELRDGRLVEAPVGRSDVPPTMQVASRPGRRAGGPQ